MKEKKARSRDALNATAPRSRRASSPAAAWPTSLGVKGGDVALNIDRCCGQVGMEIVRRALEEPLRQIVANGGLEASVIVAKVKEGSGSFGFNAQTGTYEDLIAAGVIDPAKVERTALQNAASVASLMLTTEALVAERPKEDDGKQAPGGGMGGMGGMGM
jgi:chaperonin GroEL